MSSRRITYSVSTGFLVLAAAGGGLADVFHAAPVMASFATLGYPAYVATLIGLWKLLGVVALVVPGRPRLKEWAYAGFVFDFSGAVFSHVAAGDEMGTVIPPLVLLAVVVTSWWSGLERRRLGQHRHRVTARVSDLDAPA